MGATLGRRPARMNEREAERRMLEQAKLENPNTVTVHPSTAPHLEEI